jgi:hypothetical protein
VEQHNKVNEIIVDDGTTGVQSVLEAAAAVVSLSGATMKHMCRPLVQRNPTIRNLVHPRGRRWPQKRRNVIPQVTTRYFGYVSPNSAGTRLIMAQQLFLGQNMVRTMYLRIGSIISGRGTQVIFWPINTRVALME